MEHTTSATGEGSVQKFLDVPYNQRWEFLKPAIIRLYMEGSNKLAQLAKRMKEEYSFDAQVHQYRYHLKKWDIKKRITTEEKGAVINALGKRRLQEGTSTSNAILEQGGFEKTVDKKQLKRYINQSIRKSAPLTLTPGLFLRYDLPYAALVRSLGGHDHTSPPNIGPATPPYLTVNSPRETTCSTSPNAMSPGMQLVEKKVLLDRARLFLDDREQELMLQMNRGERKSAATWLHDFWMYCFMTAKYWGRGPETWSFSLINFKSFAGNPIASTPDYRIGQEQSSESLSPIATSSSSSSLTQLCRWSIHHLDTIDYERIQSPPPDPRERSEEQFDVEDESTWSRWSGEKYPEDLATTINQGLQQNIFTAVQPESLPLAAHSITEAVGKSPGEMKAEALGFAIMSRNVDIVRYILEDDQFEDFVSRIFPYHLAAKSLDGGKTCCLILNNLLLFLDESSSIGVNYVDNSGHTVLDTLFVTILRSHSTVHLQALSDAFLGQARYPGQEVDPCGRWDADSPCIRRLYASGSPTIPPRWKHMFCHTSVQAVCHFMSIMFSISHRPNINTLSGLFVKRCGHCGLELKLGPLHVLVLTAFHVASSGMPGENLFGLVSCLVCLLTFRANPCVLAEVSIPALLGKDTADDLCQHTPMNAADLASTLHSEETESWTSELELGWQVLDAVLQQNIRHRQQKSTKNINISSNHLSSDAKDDTSHDGDPEDWDAGSCTNKIHKLERLDIVKLVHCGNRRLGVIWAAIQAELLTYRRLNEGDSWLSSRFDMELLLKGLQQNDDECLNQLAGAGEGRLKDYSCCGLFDAKHPGCARREEVCTDYYANLDDWKRTTFIEAVGLYL
ncbi:hypothetical protein F5Y13DRAFT_199610 [Hypoxylon sp. FL1857]|nr:hypothetical protein F5Y13DRAFT_199610 [Hypoxylon sp. FL1857]